MKKINLVGRLFKMEASKTGAIFCYFSNFYLRLPPHRRRPRLPRPSTSCRPYPREGKPTSGRRSHLHHRNRRGKLRKTKKHYNDHSPHQKIITIRSGTRLGHRLPKLTFNISRIWLIFVKMTKLKEAENEVVPYC